MSASPDSRIPAAGTAPAPVLSSEFTVTMVGNAEDALAILRVDLETENERLLDGRDKQPDGKVTVSVGVAAFPEDATTKQGLIQAADEAMYNAKHAGRNKVVLAGGAPPPPQSA